MSGASSGLERLYAALDGLAFPWCEGCGECCHMPWVLAEEEPGIPTEERDGTRFVGGCAACVAKVGTRCGVYAARPLDCRLFPLDIVEHEGAYWWCIFQTCRHPAELAEQLIPRIPALEAAMSAAVWAQFERQIAHTRTAYAPYAAGQYRLVRRVALPTAGEGRGVATGAPGPRPSGRG